MDRRFAVICNPSAAGGRAGRELDRVAAEFERHGAEHRVVPTRSIEHAQDETRAAIEAGETVAAHGGDGLLRPVAAVLKHTGTALAIIPGGRGNDFARVLGVPAEIPGAVELAVTGGERLVDLGSFGGSTYIGIASFGFDSEANRIANEAKLVRGNLVYLYAAVRALAGWRHARFEVTVDGERHPFEGWSVALANSRAYGGGMFIAPDAELGDGLLDVVMIAKTSRLRFFSNMPKLFKGTHVKEPSVTVLRGAVIEVSADRPFTVYADGDPVGELPATARADRHALRVIAPA